MNWPAHPRPGFAGGAAAITGASGTDRIRSCVAMSPASQQHLQRGFSPAMRSVAAAIAAARDQETLS